MVIFRWYETKSLNLLHLIIHLCLDCRNVLLMLLFDGLLQLLHLGLVCLFHAALRILQLLRLLFLKNRTQARMISNMEDKNGGHMLLVSLLSQIH